MSSLTAQHPDDGLLLRFIDGELPARKTRQVTRHLEACWQCRAEVEDLEATVAHCVRYRRNVLAAHLPPPPQPWHDLTAEFERIDASWRGEPWLARLAAALRSPAMRPWAVTAATIALFCGLYWKFQGTPAVEAAALLKRAVAAQDAQPAGVRRIQVRTRGRKFTRTVGAAARAAASDPAAAALEVRLAAAHYDWQDPLSARTFEAWRDTLPAKRDQVTTQNEAYRLQTTAPAGDLASASLTLRETDLRPLEARIEFRDQEWVEFSEVTDASTRDDAPPVITGVEPPVRRAEPSRPAAAPSRTVSISDELRVVAALHEIGADLGDPVEVVRTEDAIRVGGVGVPAARQAQVQKQLAGMPNVVVEFTAPAPAPADSAETPSTAQPRMAATSEMQKRLEQQLGGHADYARFSAYVLERDEALTARAYALRALAQRFPAAQERELSPDDRRVVREIAREHAAALEREATTVARLLQPVLAGMGGSGSRSAASQTADWHSSAEELLLVSRRVEVQISRLLGVSPVEGSADRLPSELLTSLNEQRDAVAQCRALLD